MKNINVIGLMTGTSCDGMDLSLVNCKKNNESIIGKTIKNYYIKYPISLTKKLLKLNSIILFLFISTFVCVPIRI